MTVFCHTDLSLYCLNALQQLPGNFKDNSLFSAVCCNGAIDLFHMFQKDDIKTYLKETWEHLFPIHIVSVFHNHEILRELIQLGVDVNQMTAYGKTAFSLAARNITEESKENNINISMNTRRYQTLQLLLKHGADINLRDKFGVSPLATACQNGHDITVRFLLKNGADINLCDEYGNSPLFTACQTGHDSTVHIFLSSRADINLCDIFGDFLSL